MIARWWRDCGPLLWVLLVGTLLVLSGLRTRAAPFALALGVVLLGVGVEGRDA